MTPGDLRLDIVRDDPADNRYLECVVEGTADYLVSGDQDLLDLREHGDVPILTPRTFHDVPRAGGRLNQRPSSHQARTAESRK